MIRSAKDSDVPALVAMAGAFHAESHYARAGINFDPASMEHTFRSFIHSPQGRILVAPEGGFAMGAVFPLYFNAHHMAGQELLLWAGPEHRNGLGKRLFNALEGDFIGAGSTMAVVTATEACRPDAVGAMYERAGYSLADRTYIKVF